MDERTPAGITCNFVFSPVAPWLALCFRSETLGKSLLKQASPVAAGFAIAATGRTGTLATGSFPSRLAEDASHAVRVSFLGSTGLAIAILAVLALPVLTARSGRRNPSVRRLIRPLTLVFFAVMGSMAVYEGLKMLADPHVTMWQSHLTTIGASGVAAVVAAYFVLQRQSRLLERAIVELRERQRAEQVLCQTEARLREALLAAQMGMWEWTVGADTVTWDENVYRLAGLDPKLPAPRFQEQHQIYPPKSWEQLKAAVENAVATGSPYEYDLEMVRPDGSTRWVIGRGEPLRDASGNITRFRGTVQDITERKRAERELRRVNRALRTIGACNQVLVRAVEEPSLLKDTCEILVGVGGYRMAWVGFAERDEAKSIRPVAHAGFEEGYLQTVSCNWADTELGRGATGTAIRTGRPAVGRDFRTDPKLAPWREEALKRRYASNIALPILVQDRVLGALTIYAEEPEAFDTQEVQLLTELSGDLAYGIQALRTKAEHKQAEAASQAAEQRLADIIEFLPDATFVIDQDKRVIAWNHACELLTGVKKQALLGQGDYAYAEPFFGERRPILIDLVDPPAPELEATYKYVQRKGDIIVGETFMPRWNGGQGAHLWEVASPLFDREGRRCGAIAVVRDVTERRRAEEALRESERKYRELVQYANSIILHWNRDGRIIFLNEYGQRFFGYTEAEICGRHVIGTLVPETETSGRSLPSLMDEICANPAAFEQNVNENMRRNGERVWIAWTNKVVLNDQGQVVEILSIGTDITARKRAEEELRRSESKYRTLVETSEDVIWSVDNRCRITFMSPAARRVYGYQPEELLGRHLTDLVPPEWLDRELQEIERVMAGGASKGYEHVFLRKDGTPVYLSCNSVALHDDRGQAIGAMGVSTDITERKRAEEELRAIQASLERRVMDRTAELAVARDRAEMADRTKSAFLATMSHELRTPLNSIIGFAGLLLQGLAGPLNAEQTKQLGMVKESGQHLLALINDVLDISKIEAGQIELANAPFDLPDSIQKVVQTVTPLATKKQLSPIVQIAPGVGQITSDRRRVEQILLNLLSNAIKFTERGEVTVTAEITPGTRHIPYSAVRISVADTGMGIKRENLDKLFQPFRQLDTGLTRQHDGTGLGLAISKRLAERLGGTITVESEWGRGSTFRCVLPIHPERKS
ncbi:MAG: PAS domain S-box protein [Terriglobia bacterium]